MSHTVFRTGRQALAAQNWNAACDAQGPKYSTTVLGSLTKAVGEPQRGQRCGLTSAGSVTLTTTKQGEDPMLLNTLLVTRKQHLATSGEGQTESAQLEIVATCDQQVWGT